jgi:hypothetical protein
MILQCAGALPERGASEPHIRVANLETHLIELHLRRLALAAEPLGERISFFAATSIIA